MDSSYDDLFLYRPPSMRQLGEQSSRGGQTVPIFVNKFVGVFSSRFLFIVYSRLLPQPATSWVQLLCIVKRIEHPFWKKRLGSKFNPFLVGFFSNLRQNDYDFTSWLEISPREKKKVD
ncbi:hypothetical protein AVEN_271916-1 [Araneus ventricosus]|uniref:Uncharacterized protein n=1 Tax=Araneus ventricosus TaxID=182803 RepID=A0A4Y2CBC0_ARAVE|nr:hypothetical protein AVEN_271916-1 [Araneus ventricosus]